MRDQIENTEFTQADVVKALKCPDSFAFFGDDEEMFTTWSLGPVIVHRDSGLLDQSNAASLRKLLASMPDLADDYRTTECNHWAVGWVNHLSYRVVDSDGKPTKVARIIKGWFDYLKNVYPIADESDYSNREIEAEWDNVKDACEYALRNSDITVTNDVVSKVLDLLNEKNPSGLENTDDNGYYPDSDQLIDCLNELGYLAKEGN